MVGCHWFRDGKRVTDRGTGRSWTVGELRSRDWDTLHQLWWVCVKERNRLATEKLERKRLDAGYGDFENEERDKTVQETMKAILDTLAERHQAYQEAYVLAQSDPDIDLSRTDGPQYTQTPYVRTTSQDGYPHADQFVGTRRSRRDAVRDSGRANHRRALERQSTCRTRSATEGEGESRIMRIMGAGGICAWVATRQGMYLLKLWQRYGHRINVTTIINASHMGWRTGSTASAVRMLYRLGWSGRPL